MPVYESIKNADNKIVISAQNRDSVIFGWDKVMESKTNNMPYLNKGSRRGKHARTTVWGKLLICECGHTFNTRRWDRPDRQPGNATSVTAPSAPAPMRAERRRGFPWMASASRP